MKLREIKLPEDFDLIQDIITRSFEYPENPEWNIEEDELEGLVDTIKMLKKIWPLMNFLGLFTKTIKHLMMGYIAEVDGVPAGLFMIQRRGSTSKWHVSTVGVLPEHRRKGIARKMVNAGLDLIRELGGEIAILAVISGNIPAYSLYLDVGFEHYTGIMEYKFKRDEYPVQPEIPDGIELVKLGEFDWKPRFELMELITPEEVKRFEPIEVGRFKQPFVMRLVIPLIKLAQGAVEHDFLLKYQGKIIGRIYYSLRKKSGGTHNLHMYLSKDHSHLADFCVSYMLARVGEMKDEKAISTAVSKWAPFAAESFEKYGFEKKVNYHRLGIVL